VQSAPPAIKSRTFSDIALVQRLKNIQTLFLDYDGCIHESLIIYAPAFRKAQDYLCRQGLAQKRDWPDCEIRPWIGLDPKTMWQQFRPDLPKHIRQAASDVISAHMAATAKSNARLYPGAADTLQVLKNRGYTLVLISHCTQEYLSLHDQVFSLRQYFEAMISSETFGYAGKADILAQVAQKFPSNQSMIGDRGLDIKAGRQNNMLTVGALYGYASYACELERADYLIDSIKQLKNLF